MAVCLSLFNEKLGSLKSYFILIEKNENKIRHIINPF
jgi:hypothetical protein